MSEKITEITQPAEVDEQRLIQNVYTNEWGDLDERSRDEFSKYLVERMYGSDDPVTQQYRPGHEIPGKSKLVFEEWRFKRTAVVLSVVATLAVNAVVNGKNIIGKAKEVAGDVAHMVDPKMVTIPEKVVKGEPVETSYKFPVSINGNEQKSGVASEDEMSAKELVVSLKKLDKNNKIKSVKIMGSASDEWSGNGVKSIGNKDKENTELALERAQAFAKSVDREARKAGLDLPEIKASSKESVIKNQEILGRLLASVHSSEYGSVLEAVSAYNSGQSMPKDLKNLIGRHIGKKRSGNANVTVEEVVTRYEDGETIPASTEKEKRDDEKHPIIPIIIPIPPVPRFRRDKRDPFRVMPIIKEKPVEKVWIELYKEAQIAKDEVMEGAWALTRKYQALYREERITQALRFDYVDDLGEGQNVNVLFVDRPELDDRTIEAVSELMLDVSMMKAGKVAENLDTVVVFPSEHTGAQHPDMIGLGIDDQEHQGTLGLAIPLLGLVEAHLPKKPTDKDIESFTGLRWTLAHEIAGHFTDIDTEEARKIDPAESSHLGKSFKTGNPWLNSGNDSYQTTARRGTVSVRQFAIPHPDGVNDEFIVNPPDDRLAKATSASLRGESPTRYGDSNQLEIHAEVAAHVTTGLDIPATESGIDPSKLGRSTYSADKGLRQRFERHVGSVENSDVLSWDSETLEARKKSFKMTVLRGVAELNTDQNQNALSETAKNQPYQSDKERIKILAHATD